MNYDTAVIGGGFYGCMIALALQKGGHKTLIIEKDVDILKRASYNNQARVHNGYHYPRSYLTAIRSHANYGRFIKDFKSAVKSKYEMYYVLAKGPSKTTSRQFVKFCQQIGSPLAPARQSVLDLFNPRLIEDVFAVDEYLFDAGILRSILWDKLQKNKIKVMLKCEVIKLNPSSSGLVLELDSGETIFAKRIYNCAYAYINSILKNSKLKSIPFKFELTEMPLFRPPKELENMGITIIDGPFFGTLPFPDKGLHSLYHVRYTVHKAWNHDSRTTTPIISEYKKSNFNYMLNDVERYMPILKDIVKEESLYEIRCVLQKDEFSDGRPILYKRDYGFNGLNVVMGGKIDNVYDVLSEIQKS